ncbi:MAG: hypothetical protein ACYTEQ_30690, partial [Planctomycetota bacterium]
EEDRLQINIELLFNELAVISANLFLGIDPLDFTPGNTRLPDTDHLAHFDIEHVEEFDLFYYPHLNQFTRLADELEKIVHDFAPLNPPVSVN